MRKPLALLLALAVLPAAADPIDTAVGHPERLAADRERDANRKPDQVLEFFGLEPGQAVLDVFAGGGYYTELAARVVGEKGQVVAYNNRAYADYAKDDLVAHFGADRLPNVTQLVAEWDELAPGAGRFDIALFVLGYHDIYYAPGDGNWRKIDGPAFLATIFESLKPGGVLGVIDHVAQAGAPAAVGNTLHRIDPARARREIEAAGFALEAEADFLRNPDDDPAQPMYAPELRGKTDRFVYRFRKPAG